LHGKSSVQCPHQIQLEKKNLPSNLPTLHPKLKKKKTKAPWEDIALAIGRMKFLSLKGFIAMNTLSI
jgi:hypothetical protein